MGSQAVSLALFVLLVVCCNGVEVGNWNLSKEEDLEFERQLKTLNKPAVRSIVTDDGDTYDCVDFYKQPAFDHPLLKNYTVDFQEETKSSHNTVPSRHSSKISKSVNVELKGEVCPYGTVPIRRITKERLVKESRASKLRYLGNENGVYTGYAIARTAGHTQGYTGAGTIMSIQNPSVRNDQYSATRVKLVNGANSIEAGWRVDPTLYGSTQTRFYLRTDVGQTHCFNALCPGFVIASTAIPLDVVLNNISQPGGDVFEIRVFINRQNNGNWELRVGKDALVVGYWPSSLFGGPTYLFSYVEWGGEAFGPSDRKLPQLGNGNYCKGDTRYDAFVSCVTTFNDKGEPVEDPEDMETFKTSGGIYDVYDEGYTNDEFKRLFVYGGPGGFPESNHA